MKFWTPLLAALFLLAPAAAHADWKRAETNHFVVYADLSDTALRSTSLRLEKLHLSQAAVMGLRADAPSAKVTVYVLKNDEAVQSTMAFPSPGVAGYYNASSRGAFAVTNTDLNSGMGISATMVLYHELTHHFMFQYFGSASYPVWYVEGLADVVGATRIDDGNVVRMGMPQLNRYLGFKYYSWYPLPRMLEARNYADAGQDLGMLYSEGWLLTHYLVFSGQRQGQLGKYLTAINAGKSYADAAHEAFGDLSRLDSELRVYSTRRALPGRDITLLPVAIGDAVITPVSAAQAAMMIDDIKLYAGVSRANAPLFASKVQADAARFPQDAFAQRLRAEADYIAGDDADLARATAAWLAAAPQDAKALLFDGLRRCRALQQAKSTDGPAWNAARAPIVAALRLSKDDPQILSGYYQSFLMQGRLPPENAQNALYRALELLPQDDDTRYLLAADFEARGLIADAINVIRPSAYQLPDGDPSGKDKAHDEREQQKYARAGQEHRENAREMLKRLEKKLAEQPAAQ